MGAKVKAAPSRRSVEERNALVVNNRGLVQMVIRSFPRVVVERAGGQEELFQVGVLGLMRAAELYDETHLVNGKPVKFSTYAVWSIRLNICRHIDTDGIIRLPAGSFRDSRYRSTAIRARKIKSGVGVFRPGDWFPLFDQAEEGAEPERPVVEADASERRKTLVRRGLALLDRKTRHAVVQCVMLGRSLAEVGRELRVSRQRAQQLRDAGLAQIREWMRRKGVNPEGVLG